MVNSVVLNVLADELTEQIVLSFDQDAVVFAETKDGDLEIKRKYEDIRCRIYDILDNNLNEGVEN